jgi:N-methylhydantoinase A
MVTLRLTAIGLRRKPEFRAEQTGASEARAAFTGTRRVYMDGAFREIPVYARQRLAAGMRVAAPAIVEQFDSTTVLFEGYDLTVDRFRNLILQRRS